MNQAVTFLTDGGDTVCDLTEGHSPLASHILDWFHIAMRLTVLNQMGKSVEVEQKGEKFEEELERVKWFLWHSNFYKALQLLEWLELDIDEEASDEARKLARTFVSLTTTSAQINLLFPIMAIVTAMESQFPHQLQNPQSIRLSVNGL